MQTLEDECISGLNMGFDGKQGKTSLVKLCNYLYPAIHPTQIETIQRLYLPSMKTIAHAAKLLKAAKEHDEAGVGAFQFENKMVRCHSLSEFHANMTTID